MRPSCFRVPRVVLACIFATTLVAGCGGSKGESATSVEVGGTPLQRLSSLFQASSRSGQLSQEDRQEVEQLIAPLLAPLDGALADCHWRVTYIDLPGPDFVVAEIVRNAKDERNASRLLWLHLLYRRHAPPPLGKPLNGAPIGRYATGGLPGRDLFVRVGNVELRVVPEAASLKSDAALRQLVGRFRLSDLAKL